MILKKEDTGWMEPYEEVYVETSKDTVGTVVEMLGGRRGEMLNMEENASDSVRLSYLVPTRGLLGFRYQFMTATRGEGFMHTIFSGYHPMAGGSFSRAQGSLIAWEPGVTTTYGLKNAEERGILFLDAGDEVYEGMVVGEHQRPGDLSVNICKKRHVTNMRQSFKEIDTRLSPPRKMSLDEAIEYLGEDELLEITPKTYNIRKRILDTRNRAKALKQTKEAIAS